MPKVDGCETARRLRACSNGRELNLVALTGWGQQEDRVQSREAGFDAHMVKPVDHDVLLEYLASLPSARTTTSKVGD